MNWTELLTAIGFANKQIIATIIKPVRKDDIYKSGRVIGFKPGVFGGGHSDYYKDKQQGDGASSYPHSFNSLDMHWIKKPKVMVEYGIFIFGKHSHFDWIDVDNCTFEIKEIK
jgi:hypothetical protein